MKKIKQIAAVIMVLLMTQGVIAQAENPIEEILRTQPKEKIHNIFGIEKIKKEEIGDFI